MKKKWLLVGLCMSASLLLFTGCVNTKSLSDEVQIQGTNKEYITYDLQEWRDLMSEMDVLRRYDSGTDIWINDRSYDDLRNSTYVGEDKSYIYVQDIDCEQGKKATKYVARHTGEGIYEVLEEARNLENGVPTETKIIDGKGQMITRTVGDYSVIGIKSEDKVGFYMMHEPFTLTNEADQTFINQFKTDGFLLKAFSQGSEESIIEIATPSFMIRTYGSSLYNSTSYYQFFRNQNNDLTKTRMVINVYGENGIYKEEFAPLQRVIAYLGGEEGLNEKIQNEVSEMIKGNSDGKVIKSGDLKCTIKKHDGLIYQEKLIEIIIQ